MKLAALNLALSGAILSLAIVAGMYFWRFWSRTGDRLFVYFALAFWVFALERLILIGMAIMTEVQPAVYLLRLVSFVLIAVAIIEKNRERSRG